MIVKSIGVLYICTGPYALFWKDFYDSFEEKFLPNTEKRYFVFTDSDEISSSEGKRIKVVRIDNQPWPLITLLRFGTFLKIEEDLNKCDYIMFSNANIVCDEIISEEEFLPQKQERIFVTTHPGYYGKKIIEFPYDRNKNSLAYVPWNCGENYVIGAMFGGTSEGFIDMCKTLKSNIEEDLKRNIIARWHDESHLNRYIIGRDDVRILSSEYCYPYGMKVSYKKKISAVSKQAKFDVRNFKGQYDKKSTITRKVLGKLKRKIKIKEHVLYLRDFMLGKKI
ncbi:MAG: glycosyl transferase family 6 [Oribacterium sp.]|nr:glycosyl transferase family 6 [Oribacterium sp.]